MAALIAGIFLPNCKKKKSWHHASFFNIISVAEQIRKVE